MVFDYEFVDIDLFFFDKMFEFICEYEYNDGESLFFVVLLI